MNKKNLQQFLLASNKAGYAEGHEKKWIKEHDGSTTINFEKGSWRSHDNFFGGEPYGGRVIIFHDNKPYWMMIYYGWVAEGIKTDPVYAILRNALMQMPKDAPFRGPREYEKNNYIYSNAWIGDVERYSGEEQITEDGELIYKTNYMGGLVDQREGV